MSALEPELRCLLLLARPRLEPTHAQCLRSLLAEPACGHAALVALAREHHLTVLTQAHLREHAPRALADEAAARLERNGSLVRLRQMELLRVQTEVLAVLAEMGAAHALLKGAAIGARHYREPLLRQSRDVDVLVEARALADAARRLLESGYAIINKVWERLQPPCLAALADYSTAIELRSPSGIIVELHRLLDHSGCVFPPQRLLREGGRLRMHGRQVPVLDEDSDTLYALFHHARHEWTLLHWIADLQAFRARLETPDLRRRAAAHGLSVTLERSLELARCVDQLAFGEAPQVVRFLSAALPHWRDPGRPDEHHDHEAAEPRAPDFRLSWQADWRYRLCFHLRRLRPTLDDYLGWPLPAGRRWLYWFTKPLRVLLRHGRRTSCC